MARKPVLSIALGQRLLQAKLDVLAGVGGRRPSVALAILTGGMPEPRPQPRRKFSPRTVYLSDDHLRDLDALVEALQPADGKRPTRSAVLRQAIEHLCADVSPHAPALEHRKYA